MLIEFSVTNYKSIHNCQTLSLVAGSYKELESNTFDWNISKGAKLLKSAAIYGPNAAGKTSLVEAISVLKTLVLRSHRNQLGDNISVAPFLLDDSTANEDSEFTIHFIEEGKRFEFGLRCSQTRIVEEWLVAYSSGRGQKWYTRRWNAETSDYDYSFSKLFEDVKRRRDWANETIENTLYLSKAVQSNSKQLAPVFNWFRSRLQVIDSSESLSELYTVRKIQEEGAGENVLNFLRAADLSISSIRIEESTVAAGGMPKELVEMLSRRDPDFQKSARILQTVFTHRSQSGRLVEFSETQESRGTRALFAFAGPWLDMLQNNRVVIVDELDSSLHPLVVQNLVDVLHRNGKSAQLVFTTHDTTVLSQDRLRRDQVWFVEKDEHQASKLYSLAEFSPRVGEALERGYLNGRYGGIPNLKQIDTNA